MSSQWTRTGRTRVTTLPRLWRASLLGLQCEFEDYSYYNNGNRPKRWEIADVAFLTESKGLDPRKDQCLIRYRSAKVGFFRNEWIVMQVCDDPESNVWRDARVEDLGDLVPLGGNK